MSKINDYARFVDSCTSETSKDTTKMCDRLDKLMGNHTMQNGKLIDCEIDMARLMTALIGMMAESGEFAEVVKKKVFQNNTQFTSDEIFHMKRELGDVLCEIHRNYKNNHDMNSYADIITNQQQTKKE